MTDCTLASFPQIAVEVGLTDSGPSAPIGSFILDDPVYGMLDTSELVPSANWTDVSADVREFTITRNMSRNQGVLWEYQTGTCTVSLDNSSGDYDPDNDCGLYAGELLPMVPVRIRVGTEGLYTGYADSWTPADEDYCGDYTELTLGASDAFKVLAGVTLPELDSATGVGDDTGTRVTDLLLRAGWYNSAEWTQAATGDSTLQGTTLGSDALSLIRSAVSSELGQVYIDGHGAVVFRNRLAPATEERSNSVQAVFGDKPGIYHSDNASVSNTLAQDPIGFWEIGDFFHDRMPDRTNHNRYATITGSVTEVDGPSGLCAAAFPAGAGNYAQTAAFTETPPSAFSVEIWFNTSHLTTNAMPIDGGSYSWSSKNGFSILLYSNDQIYFDWGDGVANHRAYGAVPGSFTAGSWHHVVGTYDGTNQVLYIDGVAVQAVVTSGVMSWASPVVRINGGGAWYPISLSNGAVYDVALTADQVAAKYAAGSLVQVDDTDTSSITYAGSWGAGSGWSGFYNLTDHYSNAAGATASFTFTGTSFVWRGYTGPDRGIATIAIDGGTAASVDFYSVAGVWSAEMYRVENLSPGVHTAVMTVTGTSNPLSSGTAIDLDVLEYGNAWVPAKQELPCTLIKRATDDTTLINDVQATRSGGTLQQVTDSDSVTKYLFPRSLAKSDLLLETDADALNWAYWVAYIGKNAESRFDEITINPQSDPANLWPQVLTRDIGDRIRIWCRPANVTLPIIKDCFIAGITHDVNVVAASWRTTYLLQDASKYSSFMTLGNATLGQLDSNALIF